MIRSLNVPIVYLNAQGNLDLFWVEILRYQIIIDTQLKGSETLKIPVYTLIPRHPDLHLLKQALLLDLDFNLTTRTKLSSIK